MTLGERIKKAREEKGLSQVRLAEILGCSDDSVLNWEIKGVKPLPVYLVKLEEALGVSLKEVEHEGARKEHPFPPD